MKKIIVFGASGDTGTYFVKYFWIIIPRIILN